jgi:hypothetical protein
VVLVSCLPVVTLGFGAALTHLLRDSRLARGAVPAVPGAVPERDTDRSGLNGYRQAAADLFAADIEAGQVPGIRRIRREMHVGQPKAQEAQAYLATLTAAMQKSGDGDTGHG